MRLLPASLSPSATRQAQEFAELLDGSRTDADSTLAPLVACAASLRPAPSTDPVGSPEFRARLRATLVEQAAARTPAAAPGRPSAATRRDLDWGTPQRPHRWRTAVAGGLLVAMLGGAGASWASSHALPGDALYGLKRGLENAQLDLARSDTARGRELIEQAEHRLSEAEALASSETAREPETRARIASALTDMDTATAAGADALTAAYRETGDPEPLQLLDRFVVEQRRRLGDLAALLDPALAARVRSLAVALGALQTRVEALLPAGAIAALGRTAASSGSAGSVAAAAAASGDGWAVSRVFNEVTGATSAPAGAVQAAGPGAGGGGTVGDAVGGVGKAVGDAVDDAGKAVGDVVGGVTGTGGSGGSGGSRGSGGSGVPLPTVTPPPVGGSTPLPTVTLPTLPPPPQVSVPPVSVPPLPSVSLPAGSPSGLPCVPVPPVTHC